MGIATAVGKYQVQAFAQGTSPGEIGSTTFTITPTPPTPFGKHGGVGIPSGDAHHAVTSRSSPDPP